MTIKAILNSLLVGAYCGAFALACGGQNDPPSSRDRASHVAKVSQAAVLRPQMLGDDVIEPDPAVNTRPPAVAAAAVGTRRIGIIMVHFGQPDSATPEDVYNTAFVNADSLKAHYAESSYGTLNLEGDVLGWYQVAPVTGCDTYQISESARAAATNAGVDLAQYDHLFYYYPAISECNFGGLGELGSPANPARQTWYNGWFGTYVFVHELGHNLGFWHARSYGCGATPLATPDQCTILDEYGDPFDPMGHGTAHYSAYHKGAQGWLFDCDIVTAAKDGVFDVAPIEVESAGAEALRIPMDPTLCPNWFSSCYYYVEYRQPIGVFDGGPDYVNSPMHDGVTIRAAADIDLTQQSTAQFTALLDMSREVPYYDFGDARLADGDVFADASGVRIAVQSADGVARVAVHYPGGTSAPVCLDGSEVDEDELCSNGQRDHGESDVDCGGPCVPCEPGDSCDDATDCWSRLCEGGVCQPEPGTCDDGIQNGTETDVDCGGSCEPCPDGKRCEVADDCQSNRCSNGICQSSQLDVTLRVYSDWNTGFCGDVTLANTGATSIMNWGLRIRFADSNFTGTWNAVYTRTNNDVVEVSPVSYNRQIWPYSTANIGFCANKTGPNYLPELLSYFSEP